MTNRVLVDSGFLVAINAPKDKNHKRAVEYLRENQDDRRDFAIFRPRHCDYLELLP